MGGPGAFIDLLVTDLMKHLSSGDVTETPKKENNCSESVSNAGNHFTVHTSNISIILKIRKLISLFLG